MRLGLLLTALLTVLLQAQLAYGQSDILTGEDIAKVLVGNTIQMNFRDSQSDFRTQTFHEYYDPDGSIYGMVNYREQAGNLKHFVGSWQVKDGKFCQQLFRLLFLLFDFGAFGRRQPGGLMGPGLCLSKVSYSNWAFDVSGEENSRETKTVEACPLARFRNRIRDHFP